MNSHLRAMGVLCFVVDLPTLSPPILDDIKQCSLQLANYYAVSSISSDSLRDRIALCYLLPSPSAELKVAYRPSKGVDFGLRDFHHAVKNLPVDSFFPDPTYSCDTKLSSLLQDQILYSWGDDSDAIVRKVVVLTSSLPTALDGGLHKCLSYAADKCISIEFVLFETRSNHLCDLQEKKNAFVQSMSHLDNCSMRTCLPEARVLDGMAKMWLRDLKDETEEQTRACFIFKINLVCSVNQMFCNLGVYINPITDGFRPSRVCRCHGTALDETVTTKMGGICCPITGNGLQSIDVMKNALKVGEKITLLVSDSSKYTKCQKVSTPIDFHVIERANLGSLSEGVLVGNPYVVTPSASHEIGEASDEMNELDLNTQIFQGVCGVLHSLDQGLVCSSNYNLEAKRSALFPCYYVLQPSDNRLMLLRRVGGLEEILPVPDIDKYSNATVPKEIEISVQNSIMMMESVDYDPFLHVRAFHQNLNLLVEDSVPLGSAPAPQEKMPPSDPNSSNINHVQPMPMDVGIVDLTQGGDGFRLPMDVGIVDLTQGGDGFRLPMDVGIVDLTQGGDGLEDEWEQLVVTEVPSISMLPVHASNSAQKHTGGKAAAAPDEKTWKILERLEAPSSSRFLHKTVDVTATTNKLIRPNFQRLKRKQK